MAAWGYELYVLVLETHSQSAKSGEEKTTHSNVAMDAHERDQSESTCKKQVLKKVPGEACWLSFHQYVSIGMNVPIKILYPSTQLSSQNWCWFPNYVAPGVGADPNRPRCRKAKQIRWEQKQQKQQKLAKLHGETSVMRCQNYTLKPGGGGEGGGGGRGVMGGEGGDALCKLLSGDVPVWHCETLTLFKRVFRKIQYDTLFKNIHFDLGPC